MYHENEFVICNILHVEHWSIHWSHKNLDGYEREYVNIQLTMYLHNIIIYTKRSFKDNE